MKCTSCKHANMLVAQPVVCHLHEYTGSPGSPVPLRHKVDFFFAYDLTRLTLAAVASPGNDTALPSPVAATCSALTARAAADLAPFPLRHRLFQAAQQVYGKYGEFIVVSSVADADVEQVTRSSYQDSEVEVNRVEYLREGRWSHRQGSWFYGEPSGSIISRGYAETSEEGSSSTGENGTKCEQVQVAGAFDGYTFIVYHVSVDSTGSDVTRQ